MTLDIVVVVVVELWVNVFGISESSLTEAPLLTLGAVAGAPLSRFMVVCPEYYFLT